MGVSWSAWAAGTWPGHLRVSDRVRGPERHRRTTTGARDRSGCKGLAEGGCDSCHLGRRGLGDDRPSRGFGRVSEAVTSELVYGRRAVREVLRGRREVLELLATERAVRDGWERKPKVVPEKT